MTESEFTNLVQYEDWWNNEPHFKTLAKGVLKPWDQESESDDIPFKIWSNKCDVMEAIWISFKGYGDAGSSDGYGSQVSIEIDKGELVIRVWSDINQEDRTHAISLKNALESKRNRI